MWYGLDEKAGTSTPRELCEIVRNGKNWKNYDFAMNVLKQGKASAKQVAVLCSMATAKGSAWCSGGRDWDEWYDAGYEGHPGQFDGEF